MANTGKIAAKLFGVHLARTTLSGTVKLSGVGKSRTILVYKRSSNQLLGETTSDAAGDWEITVDAGPNDLLRAIAVGVTGENSAIYEHLNG